MIENNVKIWVIHAHNPNHQFFLCNHRILSQDNFGAEDKQTYPNLVLPLESLHKAPMDCYPNELRHQEKGFCNNIRDMPLSLLTEY